MKKLYYIFGVILFLIPNKIYALSINDMENKLNSLRSYYYSYNSNITTMELNSVNNEIITLRNEISDILSKEKEYEKEISIKKSETNWYFRYLQTSYLSNPYIEYLFDSDTYSEFIYKYGVISQLSEYNNSIIDDYNNLINELDNRKKYLLEKEKKLETKKKSYIFKLNNYRTYNVYDSEGGNIYEDIKVLTEKIEYYKNKGCNRYVDVSVCDNIKSSNNMFEFPVSKGCVTSIYTGDKIRDDYSELGGHYGIDLDCSSEGEKIYPVNDGVVIQTGKYSCGGKFIYVYHNIDNKTYTSVYMHLLDINVSVGDVVTKDSVIGLMGGESTAVKNGGYDRCTKGVHLHFGISYGYNISTDEFNINSFNPNAILDFPDLYYDTKEYFYR